MSWHSRIEALGWLIPGFRDNGTQANEAAAVRVVEIPGYGALPADACLDMTGETCLRTNLITKRALDAARVGMVIEIVSDNLSSVETIPFMLPGHGCEHLGTIHLDGSWKIFARKRGD